MPVEELMPSGPVVDLPARIGDFEIIEELGRGGMGRVFAARQIGLGRIVALKAILVGRSTADLELRFLREAQTVARLRHPHIVMVHDSGRAHGYVYFSMDYIEGGDLARRLRERPIAPREGAELLRKVAAALAYTHAEGVLHRDLKPSNILLEAGEPRLADFGLAAQLEVGGDLTAATGVLGTPHYLAPEALRHGSAALSVASDVYALGVILFELLTGRTPFSGASPAELPALVDNTEPPAPHLLAPAVPRELETICLKCLERDPARRYASAAALTEDLRRWIADEPILARPPSRMERVRRFARRHRAAFAATTTVVVVLVAAATVGAALALRATRAERRAATEAMTSRELANFLQNDLLTQASPGAEPDREVKLRTVLDRAAKKIDGRFSGQPLVEAELRETLGRTYRELGEYETARGHFERAYALRLAASGERDPATWRARCRVAEMCYHLADYATGERLAAFVLAAQARALGPEHADTLDTKSVLASLQHAMGQSVKAEVLLREALAVQQRQHGLAHLATLETLGNLSSVYLDTRRFAEAEALLRPALAACLQHFGPENLYTMLMANNLAGAVWCQGRYAEAAELHRRNWQDSKRVLGPEHPDTLRSLNNVARCHFAQEQFAEAAALHAQILEARRRLFGAEYHETLRSMAGLAAADRALGKLAEAEALFAESFRIAGRVLGAEHPDTLQMLDGLADTLLARGAAAEAEKYFRDDISRREKATAADWAGAAARSGLGQALVQLGRNAEAEPLLIAGYEGLRKSESQLPASERKTIAIAGARVVALYTRWGKPEEAQLWQRKLEVR